MHLAQLTQRAQATHSWAVILSFLSRVLAFLFSPEEGDTDGHVADRMGRENTKHGLPKRLATQHAILQRTGS